jgi:hypothetical protein
MLDLFPRRSGKAADRNGSESFEQARASKAAKRRSRLTDGSSRKAILSLIILICLERLSSPRPTAQSE